MRVRDLMAALVLGGCFAHAGAAEAQSTRPSFSCLRAFTPTARAICASPALAAVDRAHAQLYRNTVIKARHLSDEKAAQRVRAAEGAIISNRNSCGTDSVCIRAAYRDGDKQMTQFLRQLD
jgi:uncharacterized protein